MLENFKSILVRVDLNVLTEEEVKKLGLFITEVYLRHLTMIKYGKNNIVKDVDLGLKNTYMLADYCSRLVKGVNEDVKLPEYKRVLETTLEYISLMEYESKKDNSVGKNLKKTIKEELVRLMVLINNRTK